MQDALRKPQKTSRAKIPAIPGQALARYQHFRALDINLRRSGSTTKPTEEQIRSHLAVIVPEAVFEHRGEQRASRGSRIVKLQRAEVAQTLQGSAFRGVLTFVPPPFSLENRTWRPMQGVGEQDKETGRQV